MTWRQTDVVWMHEPAIAYGSSARPEVWIKLEALKITPTSRQNYMPSVCLSWRVLQTRRCCVANRLGGISIKLHCGAMQRASIINCYVHIKKNLLTKFDVNYLLQSTCVAGDKEHARHTSIVVQMCSSVVQMNHFRIMKLCSLRLTNQPSYINSKKVCVTNRCSYLWHLKTFECLLHSTSEWLYHC